MYEPYEANTGNVMLVGNLQLDSSTEQDCG